MSITAPLLAYSGEWGSFLMWKTSFSYQYDSGYIKYLVMLNMTSGNAIFWHLTSNRDWHRKKKEEIFERERENLQEEKIKTKKKKELRAEKILRKAQQAWIRLAPWWLLSLNLFLFLGNPAWFYSLWPEPTTAMAFLLKSKPLRQKQPCPDYTDLFVHFISVLTWQVKLSLWWQKVGLGDQFRMLSYNLFL